MFSDHQATSKPTISEPHVSTSLPRYTDVNLFLRRYVYFLFMRHANPNPRAARVRVSHPTYIIYTRLVYAPVSRSCLKVSRTVTVWSVLIEMSFLKFPRSVPGNNRVLSENCGAPGSSETYVRTTLASVYYF